MKKIIILSLLLSGCAVGTLERHFPDGSTMVVHSYVLGNNVAFESFTSEIAGDKVSVNKATDNQTGAISAIVEGAIKGAALAVKP